MSYIRVVTKGDDSKWIELTGDGRNIKTESGYSGIDCDELEWENLTARDALAMAITLLDHTQEWEY